MASEPLIQRLRSGMVRVVRILTRPVRRSRGDAGLIIQTYRGYGSREEILVVGRVFRQPGRGGIAPSGRLGRDLLNLMRRMVRWGAGNVTLEARFRGQVRQLTTDQVGYFKLRLRVDEPIEDGCLWHPVELRLASTPCVNATAEVFISPGTARFVVISDIDDTVVYTGVANKLGMMWRLFMQGAQSRTAFPGVARLYRALHEGQAGHEHNPMLYVSRGPWGIYEMLEEFFHAHEIPAGPVLFLRDWGLSLQRPLPRRARSHKENLIAEMLEIYRDLPFVLIGDSGQHDPEVYARVVKRHPGRVRAVYIRNVTESPGRSREIRELAESLANTGSTLVLASGSAAMARHAADHGLISADQLDALGWAGEKNGPKPAARRAAVTQDQQSRADAEPD